MHSEPATEVPLHERVAERRTGKLLGVLTVQNVAAVCVTVAWVSLLLGGRQSQIERNSDDIKQLQQYREVDHTLLIRIAEKLNVNTDGTQEQN